MHVQVALEVGERHQLGERVLARRLELAAALAQLGRDPRQAEPLVDRLLARAAQRLARFVVEDPVLGDVQAAADRALAQRHVVGLGAREVLEHVAELVGLDDLEVDLHPRVGGHAGARVARGLHGLHELELAERARERLRVAGRGDDVEVLDGVGAAAQRAGHLDPVARGMLAQGGEDLLRDRLGAREHHPWGRPARGLVAGQRLLELRLGLQPEAAQLPDRARLERRPQRVQRVDAELVVELAGALGPEAGQAHELDQARRELRPQLHEGRDVARLVERAQLLLERLADAGDGRHATLARHGDDRDGGLAHGLGRVAVGDHPVGDRAVELVEVAELVERGGDLGVGGVGHSSFVGYAAAQ